MSNFRIPFSGTYMHVYYALVMMKDLWVDNTVRTFKIVVPNRILGHARRLIMLQS